SLITRITKADPREVLAKCKASRTFCWIARKADAETAARLRPMNLPGIYFQTESKRLYPKRELAAQVIGYVGTDDEGLSGIEREYEDKLHGKSGRMLISVDARRKYFGSVEKQPEPGENVVLTLDEQIQYIAERELEAAMQQTHAESGTVIVENPHTGEILALANRPTFNPNLSREITPQKLKNHAVSDVYEPGSTFKVVTIAGALEEKVTRPDEVFDCEMGSKVSIAAISMGQEIGITPLQLVGLVSTMANDGIYLAPRVVAATSQQRNAPQTIAFHPVNEHRVLSAFAAAEMRQMMQGVVLHG